jgi:hypothetical protein
MVCARMNQNKKQSQTENMRIYPKNFECLNHINKNTKYKILCSRNIIEQVFSNIWTENHNQNFFRTILTSTIFYFYNFSTIYDSLNEKYAYNYFFTRIIEILYEFVYDLYGNATNIDEIDKMVMLFISKIRNIEKDGCVKYMDLFSNIFKINRHLCNNKEEIKCYENIIFSPNTINTHNLTEEYIEIRNYIKNYEKKKSQVNDFIKLYVSKYDNLMNSINKLNFASLYQIPSFLLDIL